MGIRERFANDELTADDIKRIDGLLGAADRHDNGKSDRVALTERSGHDLYRFFGVVEDHNYDGDSWRMWIDKAFGASDPDGKIRLWGVNADEIRGGTAGTRKAARVARDVVRELIGGRGVILKSHKMRPNSSGAFVPGKGRYGRYLFEVLALDENGDAFNLSEFLVDEGLAEFNTYGDRFEGWAKL